MKKRYILLDALRGLAVMLMFIFHLAVDLQDFYGFNIGYRQGLWYVLNQAIVIIFLLVSGYATGSGLNKNTLRNGLKLLAAACIVSAATYFFDSHSYVRFGILHLLACAMLLAPLFLRLSNILLFVLSLFFVILGSYAKTVIVSTSILLPFGIMPDGFYSIDYYPLLPWLAIFIWGIVLGRKLELPDKDYDNSILQPLAFMGRHALLLYLVHQPLFLLFLHLLIG